MHIVAIIAAAIIACGAVVSGGVVAYAKADAAYDRAATHARVFTLMHG